MTLFPISELEVGPKLDFNLGDGLNTLEGALEEEESLEDAPEGRT